MIISPNIYLQVLPNIGSGFGPGTSEYGLALFLRVDWPAAASATKWGHDAIVEYLLVNDFKNWLEIAMLREDNIFYKNKIEENNEIFVENLFIRRCTLKEIFVQFESLC